MIDVAVGVSRHEYRCRCAKATLASKIMAVANELAWCK